MEKRQLIDAIRQLNTSATIKFLSEFDEPSLQQYLDHLNAARTRQPRPAQAANPSRDRMVA